MNNIYTKYGLTPCILLTQVKRYFVSFWNGVDLRYRLLKGPRIRISIAGIIISRVSSISFLYSYYIYHIPIPNIV